MPAAIFSLELASGALTRWQGPDLKSFCRHDGSLIASDGQALYRLGGDDDAGTPMAVQVSLPATDGGLTGPKRLRAVRLEGAVPGQVTVTAVSDSGSRLQGLAGPAGQDGLPGLAVARLGRGYGRSWRLDLRAGDGAGLDIAAIEAELTPLGRRDL